VLRHPAVASKTFLVSIGDRTVGGLCARDPFVGPWQVPVADCAVTLLDYDGYAGEAFAVGERTPLCGGGFRPALGDALQFGRQAAARRDARDQRRRRSQGFSERRQGGRRLAAESRAGNQRRPGASRPRAAAP